MKHEFYATVSEGGNIPLATSQKIKNCLLSFKGQKIEITIQKLKSRRSYQQNRLWWLYINILSQELGYTKDEIHDIAKFKFLRREKVDEKTGEIFPYLQSTTKLSKSEFSDLTSELIRWAAETFDIKLPQPNEQLTF